MNILATFNDNNFEPIDYLDRPTVKAIILNEQNEVLLFSGGLPGGGVEDGETSQEALARELMEEIGATVSITKKLGNVIAYRDGLKLKYIFTGYQCSLISMGVPTTDQEKEIGKKAIWVKIIGAIESIKNEVEDFKKRKQEFSDIEQYQRRVFNRETALVFLKQIK